MEQDFIKYVSEVETKKALERVKGEEKKDIRSEVYNALSDVMFKTGASKEDMEEAIEWFMIHFYD